MFFMKKTILGLFMTALIFLMPSAFAEDREYTYSINNMYFSDLYGNAVSEVNNSCMVNITVSKNAYRAETDSIIIASYATDGELIGFSMMRGTTTTGTDTEFATLVHLPEGKQLGVVKAYVWNSLSGMVPLSETTKKTSNEMLTPSGDLEKYIPDYFEVYGTITGTSKTGDTLYSNEYKIYFQAPVYNYDDCYTAEQIEQKKKRYDTIYSYYELMDSSGWYGGNWLCTTNNIDLSEYINHYMKFTIQVDESNNYFIKDFTTNNENTIENLNLALIDDAKYSYTEIIDGLTSDSPYIYVYESVDAARSTKYKLERDFKFYVNGVAVNTSDANLEQYIVNNLSGNLKLIDTYQSDVGYDLIFVDYYDTTAVTSKSSKNIYIHKNRDGLNATSLPIDSEDLEEYEITMNVYLNGEKVDPSEIKKGDILSIKYDVNMGSDSSFFDIYISRDTAEGKFVGKDVEERTVTIGEEKYVFVDWTAGDAEFDTSNMGNEYKIYLDIFGRIYTSEAIVSAANYAIALRTITMSSWDNAGLQLFLSDGTIANYEFASNVKVYGEAYSVDDLLENISTSNVSKADMPNQIISYALNSSGKLSKVELLPASANITSNFDTRYSKIGSIFMNSSTIIMDATKYYYNPEELSVINVDALTDGARYEIYAYGYPSETDDTHPFVLITDSKSIYGANTSFAVVTKDMYPAIKDDGEEGYMLEVLYEGSEEVQKLFIDEDANYYDDAWVGDVIVLEKDADGDVKEYNVIYRNRDFGTEDFVESLGSFDEDISLPTEDWDTAWVSAKDMKTSLVFGPIVERNGHKLLAQVKDYKTYFYMEPSEGLTSSEGATLFLSTTDDTNVYVYDINNARNDRFYVGTSDDILPTRVDHITSFEDPYRTIDWTLREEYDQVNFAFAKVVDGIVTDIFVIIGIE